MNRNIDIFFRHPIDEILMVVSTAELLNDTISFTSKGEIRDFVKKQKEALQAVSLRMDKILKRIVSETAALTASTEWARRVRSILDKLEEIEDFTAHSSLESNISTIRNYAALIIAYLNGARATITLYEDLTE